MNLNVDGLVPSQISELINKLQNALKIIKYKKQTISKVALYEKGDIVCPYCNNNIVVKYGHTKTGIQNYKCKNCNRRFNDLTNTVVSGTHLNYEQLEIFLKCFQDKVTIRKTANRMRVNKKTAHLLRLKMIDALNEIRKNTKLSGETEADEIYKSINLKGTKPEKMPRASKHRKSKLTTSKGISKHKVCIASAIDEMDNKFLEIAGTGPITSNMVKDVLTPKVGKISKLITDCKSSYESEALKNKWNLIQIKSTGHSDNDGNCLANINSLHSGLTTFLSTFRGVSTKHLQGYLDWYCFDRYLNFSFEDVEQFDELLNETMTNSTIINSSNAYENYSGIDFYKVYSDYNFKPSI